MKINKIILILVLSIFLVSIISAQVSYCCERLVNDGPWCQNAPEEECDSNYLSAPTSCEATSYCRLGTCINSIDGVCMPNTPQRVCIDAGGTWDEREEDEIPQCQLGCCLIGEQASFTTLTRCKSLSSMYGLEINYRADVQNEIQCIALAGPKTKGACVFEEEYQKNCKMMTKVECQELDVGDNIIDFYDGYLCSAESLETICGPRGGTTCVEGRDEVYFLDTCGNVANIYDHERLNDPLYWETIMEPTCGDGAGNQGSPTCGDCDYFLGSMCKRAERGESPNYGNYICKDLSCEYEEENYEHGETWCGRTVLGNLQSGANPGITGNEADNINKNSNNPGNRDFRLVCYNGEVSVEPCADFRQEICIESEVNTFSTAACSVNMWQDCYSQTNERDCTNIDKRDCRWIIGVSILKDEDDLGLVLNTDGELVSVSDEEDFEIENGNLVEASCIPKYAPGFDFWEEGTDAGDICERASTVCYVEYSAYATDIGGTAGGGLWGNKGKPLDAKCMDNCRNNCYEDTIIEGVNDPLNICNRECEKECPSPCVEWDEEDYDIDDDWKEEMNNICMAMGDCGSSVNYINEQGYYDRDSDFISRSSDEKKE